LLASLPNLVAFAPNGHFQRSSVFPTSVFRIRSLNTVPTMLRMKEEEGDKTDETESVEDSAGEGEDDADEKEEEPQEDPEITALKEEIAALEATLKTKRSTLSYTQDQSEEYSKGGYARKVAEMENMRRARSVS
jgi:hypothetical protein